MIKTVARFARSQSGATAVEYALICMCVVLAIIVSLANLGTQLNNTYVTVEGSFN